MTKPKERKGNNGFTGIKDIVKPGKSIVCMLNKIINCFVLSCM